MKREVRMICLLAFSCVALLSAGCSNKNVRSGGSTSRSAPAPVDSASGSYSNDLLSGEGADPERLNSNIAMAKVDEGMGLVEATLAGAKLRLRPIVMTSLAFGFGVLPLADRSGHLPLDGVEEFAARQ